MSKIERGTIKVVWASKDGKKLYSKMFDTIKEGKKFGETKKDYLMMKLVKETNFNEFEWITLPYGKTKVYEFIVKIYNIINKIFN